MNLRRASELASPVFGRGIRFDHLRLPGECPDKRRDRGDSCSFEEFAIVRVVSENSIRRFEVARHPTAEWLARQITEAFPWNPVEPLQSKMVGPTLFSKA
jgi:hypothetical protein